MLRFWSFLLMIFVAVFSATDAVAVEGGASWGAIKSQVAIGDASEPAGKLVISAERAGDVRYLVYRQPVGGDPQVIGDEYGLPVNLSFREIHGVKNIYAWQDRNFWQDAGLLHVNMDIAAALINPEAKEFGLIYSLGNDRVQVKTRFFGYDAERTHYMVQFSVTYTGSPAQEHILGNVSGDAVMSVWYTPERAGAYDGFLTTAIVRLVGVHGGISISLEPIGSLPRDVPELLWHQAGAGVVEQDRGVFGFTIFREPGVRFFWIRAEYFQDPDGRVGKLGEWIVQLPFVEELDVILLAAPEVAQVALSRK